MPGLLRKSPEPEEVPEEAPVDIPIERVRHLIMSRGDPRLATTNIRPRRRRTDAHRNRNVSVEQIYNAEVSDSFYMSGNNQRTTTRSNPAAEMADCVEVQEWLLSRYGYLRKELESVEEELTELAESMDRHSQERTFIDSDATDEDTQPETEYQADDNEEGKKEFLTETSTELNTSEFG